MRTHALARTAYARSNGRAIGYQVIGAGPLDLVLVPGFVSNLELQWELPTSRTLLEGLSRIARVITFDKPGTGLSDPVPPGELPGLRERLDDVLAVMDAAGASRALVVGASEGGPLAVALAALAPERVDRLVLYGTFATLDAHPDRDRVEAFVRLVEGRWGSGEVFALLAPSVARTEQGRDALARFERHAAPPANAATILAMALETNVEPLLDLVTVPTLVLARADDRVVPPSLSQHLAARVRGAVMELLPGDDHWIGAGDVEAVVRATARFAGAGTMPSARRFAALAFVDVAGSTDAVRRAGDRTWSIELADLHREAAFEVDVHGGRIVTTIGDGLLAEFPTASEAVACSRALVALAGRRSLVARAGVHAAEVEHVGDDVAGVGVHVAARVEQLAASGEVWVTRTVRDLVAGSCLRLEPRGHHVLKGFDEPWQLWAAAP